jgi:predicted phosphoribosyltransferase
MAVPAKQNLSMTRGDTETVVVTMKDSTGIAIDITGRTYRAQIRTTKDSSTIDASFSCSISNAAAGEVTCTILPITTATLTVGTHYWDFEETSDGVVSTILAGSVNVLADVTR